MKNLISTFLIGPGVSPTFSSDPLAPAPMMRVEIGPDRWVTLCHRVFMAKGHGQVWHVVDPEHPQVYVVCRWDVNGRLRWSLVQDVAAMAQHFGIRLRDDGEDVWDDYGVNPLADFKKFLEGL